MSRRSLISARSGIGWLGTVLKIGLLSSPGLRWLWDARLDASRKFQTNLWHLVKICDFRVMTSNSWRSIVNYGYWASRCFTTRDPFLTHGTYIVEQQPPALLGRNRQIWGERRVKISFYSQRWKCPNKSALEQSLNVRPQKNWISLARR